MRTKSWKALDERRARGRPIVAARIDRDLWQKLKATALERQTDLSTVLREALSNYLNNESNRKQRR